MTEEEQITPPPQIVAVCEPESLRELLIQSNENARAVMDLRFKHFTTFMVLTALLGTAIFQIEELKDIQKYLAWGAAALSVLFWLLDYRTSQLHKIELNRVARYEFLLHAPPIAPPTLPKTIGASRITNAIFTLCVCAWVIVAIASGNRTMNQVGSNKATEPSVATGHGTKQGSK